MLEDFGYIVSVENKTETAYKRYGMFTYDGTHLTLFGSQHIAGYEASNIASILKIRV